MTIDLNQFYQVFFEEAAEHLANMEKLLLDLDVEAPSLDDLNAIFRAAHSIKGASGTFGFTDMAEITHVLETLLDKLRRKELPVRAEMVDVLLKSGDVLRAQLEHHQGGPEADAGVIGAVRDQLAQLADAAAAPEAPASAPSRRLVLECLLAAERLSQPEIVDKLLAALADVADCELTHRPEAGDTRLSLRLTTTHDDADIHDALAFYFDQGEVSLREEGKDEGYGFFVEIGQGAAGSEAAQGCGPVADVAGTDTARTAGKLVPATVEGDGWGLFVDIATGKDAVADSTGAGTSVVARDAGATAAPPYGRRASDNPALDVARSGRRETDKQVTSAAAEASSIRVAVEKVDQLINLVGELVITQAMIADAASHLDPLQVEKLLSGIDLLSRNTRDLQESVMSIRMLPMSMVFSRFPRMVRDLAGKLGKQVELKTVGEATELDKGLIEKIIDPLTHLVRNSLDHGFETPEKRVAAGKPPRGTLTLKASHQGGAIVIEVMDDGAGLSRGRILAKAKEKGMEVSDAMSNAEVWQLIMAPGFSTAEVVTDVSGRGVGMDVVKKNIEGLGGKVELESAPGFGTRIAIRLPLTLAILDGMSVGVNSETFIIPLTAIVESLQAPTEAVKTLGGDARVINIRGDYLPIVPLAEIFDHGPVEDLSNGIVVVVDAEDGRAALFVDELLGQHQVVIKNLEANYRKVPGISGATIMGDGSVALILDIAAVIRLGLRNAGHRSSLPQHVQLTPEATALRQLASV